MLLNTGKWHKIWTTISSLTMIRFKITYSKLKKSISCPEFLLLVLKTITFKEYLHRAMINNVRATHWQRWLIPPTCGPESLELSDDMSSSKKQQMNIFRLQIDFLRISVKVYVLWLPLPMDKKTIQSKMKIFMFAFSSKIRLDVKCDFY